LFVCCLKYALKKYKRKYNLIMIATTSHDSFKSLGLSDLICDAYSQLGYQNPTPIQSASIPIGLERKNIIAQAKAGTGKTLAFASVALSLAESSLDDGVYCVIVLPTREIAIQVFDVIFQVTEKILKKHKKEIKVGLCIGGLPIEDDRNFLRQKGHIVVGTLGRLQALLQEKSLSLGGLKLEILDEADKLTTKENFSKIKKFQTSIPKSAQILAFSATYTSEDLVKLKTFIENTEVIQSSFHFKKPIFSFFP
jgi:superfamily II DNA/RNA helicase